MVEFARVSSPLWTVPKVPLPRNSPNCNCDGSIVVACGEILTPASNKCDDDDDDDDGVVGIDGTNPKADGRKMQNSIKTPVATSVDGGVMSAASCFCPAVEFWIFFFFFFSVGLLHSDRTKAYQCILSLECVCENVLGGRT